MKGVAIPSVSPGSSQREASVMWTPQVMVPVGRVRRRCGGTETQDDGHEGDDDA